MVCKLEAGKKYNLNFGNNKISVPVYDLNTFSDKIPAQITLLKTGDFVSTGKIKAPASSGLQLDGKYIWLAIIAVVILLVYMVLKMLKDMKSSKEKSQSI